MKHYNSKQLWIWGGLEERKGNKTEGSDKEDHHPKGSWGGSDEVVPPAVCKCKNCVFHKLNF